MIPIPPPSTPIDSFSISADGISFDRSTLRSSAVNGNGKCCSRPCSSDKDLGFVGEDFLVRDDEICLKNDDTGRLEVAGVSLLVVAVFEVLVPSSVECWPEAEAEAEALAASVVLWSSISSCWLCVDEEESLTVRSVGEVFERWSRFLRRSTSSVQHFVKMFPIMRKEK